MQTFKPGFKLLMLAVSVIRIKKASGAEALGICSLNRLVMLPCRDSFCISYRCRKDKDHFYRF